jgi:hypothetical protein
MERLFTEINKRDVHYGNNLEQIKDLFARKQETLKKQDDKFFSRYWQVYAWAAIIGFVNNKREEGAELTFKNSFQFQMITNGSESIANGLLLMAFGKVKASDVKDLLNARNLLTIISEYAEGGAKHILEIRQTPGFERKFDSPDDYILEVLKR